MNNILVTKLVNFQTKLLIEVNDLLNSPLLKSSHSNKKCDELEEILSHLSKVIKILFLKDTGFFLSILITNINIDTNIYITYNNYN